MYFSLRNTLQTCTKILENLEGLTLLLTLDDEDYSFFKKRMDSSIKCKDLTNYLLLNSYSLADLVAKISSDINYVNELKPERVEKIDVNFEKYNHFWNEYLEDKKGKDVKEMMNDVSKLSNILKKWIRVLEEEEDRGTESSYSDYSGDSTDTSEEESSSQRRSSS